jgi:integrase
VLGLRRNELACIQIRDFDAQRGWLRVYGKGQKERLLPLRGPILAELRLLLSSDLPHVGRPPQGDDYLLYPVRWLAAGKGAEGQLLRKAKASPRIDRLGHSDLSTTLGIYGYRDDSDLETAMEAYARRLEDQAPSVPPEGGN